MTKIPPPPDCIWLIQGMRVIRDKLSVLQGTQISKKRFARFMQYKYFTRFAKRVYNVPYNDVCTEQKLARFVRKNYGFGEWLILMPGKNIMSKRYKPNFICTPKIAAACIYRKGGSCTRALVPPFVRIGMSCLKNKRRTKGLKVKAAVVIDPIETFTEHEDDYAYKFDRSRMSMQTLPFWRGDIPEKKIVPYPRPEVLGDNPKQSFLQEELIKNPDKLASHPAEEKR